MRQASLSGELTSFVPGKFSFLSEKQVLGYLGIVFQM